VYSVLLSLSLSLLLGFGPVFLGAYHWAWGILFSLIVLVVVWILLTRRLAARLQPAMSRMQKQVQAGHLDAAMQSLEELLPMSRWVPLLRGQLLANMGMLAWRANKKDRALELLEGSSIRAAEARLMLACIHYKNGQVDRALQVLQLAGIASKKHALLHNTHAWMLHKQERPDEAQKVLAAFNKRDPGNEPTKDNLLRLQNRTRMTMHAFAEWFALGLEQPPQEMGQMRRAPKGFREPPKRRG
jgi:tetratricopeptide (TPR) repeat protein